MDRFLPNWLKVLQSRNTEICYPISTFRPRSPSIHHWQGANIGKRVWKQDLGRSLNRKQRLVNSPSFLGQVNTGQATKMRSHRSGRTGLRHLTMVISALQRRSPRKRQTKAHSRNHFSPSPSKPAPDAFAGELRTSDPPVPDFSGRNFAAPKQPPANLDRDGRPAAPRFDSTGEFGGVGKSRNYTPSGPAPFEVDHAPNFQPGASIGVPEPAWDGAARPADASKDATHLFTPPGAGPMPSSLPQEEGPSEFTMVLQRGNQAPPPPQAPAGKGPASGPSNFKLPAMQVPQIPSSPVMPQAPQMPHMQTPQIPQAPSLPMAASEASRRQESRASSKESYLLPAADHYSECCAGAGGRAGTLLRAEITLRTAMRSKSEQPTACVVSSSGEEE